jgi:iron(III) transport system substrate-binding protein
MYTKPKLRFLSIAIAGATALALAGCSAAASPNQSTEPSAASPAGPTGEITVYNAQHEELTQAWADEFSRESGVTVTLRNGSDSELGNQIVQEGDASPADVFLTENSPAISLVDNAGLLAEVDSSTLAQVPEQYRPSSGTWTGIAARSTVLVYNTSLISADQLPKSLLDLADPAWKGRWAASPSGADFQAIVSGMLELEGKDATASWLAAMKENALVYKGNSTVMKAVNAGEVPAGVIYHYYWYGDQSGTGENSSNTQLHYFKNEDAGAFLSVSGGGVLASSKNPTAAQAFLAYITGKQGQLILQTGSSYEYPVASDVEANPDLVPLTELDAPVVDPSDLNSKTVTDLMTQAGLL